MGNVLTGSDVLASRGFSDLAGLRIGFVGNHTSRLTDGTPTHLALHGATDVTLVKLFSPEHGAFGREDREDIENEHDPATGLPIFSLYGATRKPTPEMLEGLDALVFELQDIGARFYTYSSTLLLCLEAAREAGIRLIVLDRPNPITGTHVEGPLPDHDKLSFTACHTIPVRHGLTLGELARLVDAESFPARHTVASDTLTVIPCHGWRRSMWWDETGLPWVNPSPAMRSLDAATAYPGVCLLEQTNVSVGRGTGAPFLIAGAPWIDAKSWANSINSLAGNGIKAAPYDFTPTLRKYENEMCRGVRLTITDRDALNSVRLGVAMICALRDAHPEEFEIQGVNRLLFNDEVFGLLKSGAAADDVISSWNDDLVRWPARIAPYLLYD